MKSVYHSHPDCNRHSRNVHPFLCSVKVYYAHFLSVLLADPALLLKLIGEPDPSVVVIRNGTYSRDITPDPYHASFSSLSIQRVLVRSSDGDFLYTRALLPGLVIPYKGYSLLFILNCLSRYYAKHKVSRICSAAGISPRQLYRWVRLAEENPELIAGFFKPPGAAADACWDLEAFPALSVSPDAAAFLKELYTLLITHAGKPWLFLAVPSNGLPLPT